MLVECLLRDVLRVTDDNISIAVTLQRTLANLLTPITIHLPLALSAIVDVTVIYFSLGKLCPLVFDLCQWTVAQASS